MKNTTNSDKIRFNHLKTQFHQAPLRLAELDELIHLAKRFNKKMAAYLESHRSELI